MELKTNLWNHHVSRILEVQKSCLEMKREGKEGSGGKNNSVKDTKEQKTRGTSCLKW